MQGSRRERREAERAATGEFERVESAPLDVPAGVDSNEAVGTIEAPAVKAPRSGRNMPVAIAVGVGLGAVIVASLAFYKVIFVVVVIAAICLALWELSVAFRSAGIHIPLVPVLVGAVGMLLSAYEAGPETLLMAFALTAGGVFVWRVLEGSGIQAVRDSAAGIFASAYVPLLAGFVMLMVAPDDGVSRVVLFLALPIASDTGGLAAGVMFGKHPLARNISPKKTWEGLAGSLLAAAVVGAALGYVLFDGRWLVGAGLGVVAVCASTFGDLSESLLKRDLGLKDMGSILPGHGGLLDRLDSILFAAPVVYLAMTLVLPVSG